MGSLLEQIRRRVRRPARPLPPEPAGIHAGTIVAYALIGAGALAVLATGSVPLATAYLVACRATYLLGIGLKLKAAGRRLGTLTGEEAEARYRRLVAFASRVINQDAVGLVVLSLAGAGTISYETPRWVVWVAGSAMIVGGFAVKAWASASIGTRNYFFRDFFHSPDIGGGCRSGPYRWFDNPIYSVGYAPAYGLPLILGSWPGLLGALFTHLMVFVFHLWVERPHVRRLYGPRPAASSAADIA